MDLKPLPILYSFRRCPYAMRARLAIAVSDIQVELREVLLSNKPKELLECSKKATVPVLVIDKKVIDESRDIMLWALQHHDPFNWLSSNKRDEQETNRLIDFNDGEFKQYLDKYKYASRFPEQSMELYRHQGEVFLSMLEEKLSTTSYLITDSITMADMAIFPFIRQFAHVDMNWFEQTEYKNLQNWLIDLLKSSLFGQIMEKQTTWQSAE